MNINLKHWQEPIAHGTTGFIVQHHIRLSLKTVDDEEYMRILDAIRGALQTPKEKERVMGFAVDHKGEEEGE